jgi:hypothetical protein
VTTVKHVERSIRDVEGFRVRLLYTSPGRKRGKDVRGDREEMPSYTFTRGARDDWTVAEWVHKRFARSYPGFDVEVLDGHGQPAHGRTKLATVRRSYA